MGARLLGQQPRTKLAAALLRMTLTELVQRYYAQSETIVAIEIANRMARIANGDDKSGKEVRVEGKCSHCGSSVELDAKIRINQTF